MGEWLCIRALGLKKGFGGKWPWKGAFGLKMCFFGRPNDFWFKNGVWGKMAKQKNFWVKNWVLGEMVMQWGFWVKDGVWEKIAVQRDFGVKDGVLGYKWDFRRKWMHKGTFGSKIGSLGKMAVQRGFWVKNGVLGGNGHAKGFLD